MDDTPLVPIVSTSAFDNGVTTWKSPDIIYSPPLITVATDGSVCSSFVQEFPFYAFYKVALLRPYQVNVPTDALYFIAYAISRERWRYVYARKFGKGRLLDTSVFVPTKRNGSPDFEAMASLARQSVAYPVIESFRKAYRQSCTDRFPDLSRQWKASPQIKASAVRMAGHPSYREITAMGLEAVPFILSELQKNSDHWFAALHEITGANPVPADKAGIVPEMRKAWLEWGEKHGFTK